MAGDLRVSMLFQANATQAKAEVAAMRSEFEQLGQGAKAAGDASSSAAPDIGSVGQAAQGAAGGISLAAQAGEEWGVFVQELRAQVQPMVGELAGLQNAMQSVALLEEVGAINAQEAALAHDQLARATTDLLGRMDAAGVSIDGTTAAMARQETAAQELINRTTGVSNAQGGSIADTLRHGAALDDLRARYNPLFAASRQYEIELRNIAEAERLGAISSNEAAAARARASQAMAPIPGQLGQLGAASKQASGHVGQLGFQLNDIVMMMSLGQSPFMLMAQQGPQVTQVFDQIRRSGQSIGSTLIGAFTGMLNPVNLATMAVIGFGAAAVQWFGASADEAKTAADAMSELADIQGRLDDTADILAMSLDKLIEKYGTYAFKIRDAAQALHEHSVAQAQDKLKTGIAEAADEWDRYASKMAAATAKSSFKELEGQAVQGKNISLFLDAEETLTAVAAIQSELKVSESDAMRLADAFARVRDAANFEDRLAALSELQTLTADLGVSSEDLPANVRDALIAAGDLVIEMGALAGAVQPGKEEMVNLLIATEDSQSALTNLLSAAPAGGWLSGAIADAAALASELWNAATASGSIGSPGGVVSAVKGGVQAAVDWFSGSDQAPETAPRPRRAPALLGEPGAAGSTGRGRSGGGRSSAAKEETSAIQKLIEQEQRQIDVLQTLSPLQEEIAKHHKDLKDATEEERAAVTDLVAERMRLQEVRDRLDEIESTGKNVFKGLVTGAMDFNDAISNILGKLADMAASAAWDMIWKGGLGGGGGLGGILGDLFGLGGALPFADGGRVNGPGGPRDDLVPAWLSNNEFVVNAAAAGPAYPFLEALNAGVPLERLIGIVGGRLRAFADGGLVSGNGVSPSSWGLGSLTGGQDRAAANATTPAPIVNINVTVNGATGNSEVRSMIDQGIRTGLKQFNDYVLPDRVAQISRSPRDR